MWSAGVPPAPPARRTVRQVDRYCQDLARAALVVNGYLILEIWLTIALEGLVRDAVVFAKAWAVVYLSSISAA